MHRRMFVVADRDRVSQIVSCFYGVVPSFTTSLSRRLIEPGPERVSSDSRCADAVPQPPQHCRVSRRASGPRHSPSIPIRRSQYSHLGHPVEGERSSRCGGVSSSDQVPDLVHAVTVTTAVEQLHRPRSPHRRSEPRSRGRSRAGTSKLMSTSTQSGSTGPPRTPLMRAISSSIGSLISSAGNGPE